MSRSKLGNGAALLILASVLAVPAGASDPVGVYGVIDRVVLEPDARAPGTIQIWGVFALSDGLRGDNYLPAERGYLYYRIDPANRDACLAEWADLAGLAGSGRPIGFGARYSDNGRVRRPGEAPARPDTYPLGWGLVRLLDRHLGPDIRYALERVPIAAAPADGARVPPGSIRLVARNVADAQVRYVFEIEGAGSARETSAPIAAGRGETTWTPRLEVRAGQQYTWRVWVVNGTWRGPAASATFVGGSPRAPRSRR